MKRFHLHLHVQDLAASMAFYSKLFDAQPTRIEADYAKWMLEDPRINFAISTRGNSVGIDHLGFQTDSAEELGELQARAEAADFALHDVGETSCCYARSDKHWITDPQGIAWEQFHTLANIPVFGEPKQTAPEGVTGATNNESPAAACCAATAPKSVSAANAIPMISIKSAASKSCC